MDKQSEFLLNSKISKLLIKLSVPAIIGMLVIGLYPLIDGIFAGQILGQNSMTAIGISTPFTYINSGISTLIGVGSASILSRALGENNKALIDKIMGNLVVWILGFSLVTTVLGIIFCRSLLGFMGAEGEILNLAERYLRIIFVGSLFVNFAQAANMIMRAEGLMKQAMLLMASGAIINIILDPILMISMGSRGIEGAAIATIIAQVLQASLTLYYFLYKSKVVKIGRLKVSKLIYKEMFAIGISAMLMQVLTIIQQAFLYSQAFLFGGDAAGAVMAAALRIQAFSFIPLWGMAQGLQPAIGSNYGAKKYNRVEKIFKMFALVSTLLAAVFWLPIEIFATPLLGLFGLDNQTLILGVPAFRAIYSIFIVYGLMIMLITFFQAIGDAKSAGILVMMRQIILFIPVVIFLPRMFGISGLWWSLPLVDGIVIVTGIIMYLKTILKIRKSEATE